MSETAAKPMSRIWHRLRAMTPAELCSRGRQKAAALYAERFGRSESRVQFASRTGLKQKELYERLQRDSYFPWEGEETGTIRRRLRAVDPAYTAALLKKADRICKHQIELLDREFDFGPKIDWHVDVLCATRIPCIPSHALDIWHSGMISEVRYIWELNRHGHLLALGQAYRLSRDERYAMKILDHWSDWLDRNPPGVGVNWTSALEAALRLINWTWTLRLIKSSAQLNAGVLIDLCRSVEQHGRFIRSHLSRGSAANNHLIGEALGLVYAGVYHPRLPDAAKWRRTGFDLLWREFPRQVYPDGGPAEQSTGYARYLLDYGLLAVLAADHASETLPGRVRDRIVRLARFLAALRDGSGSTPDIGDDDGGRVLGIECDSVRADDVRLTCAAAVLGAPGITAEGSARPAGAFWIAGPAGIGGTAGLDSSCSDPPAGHAAAAGKILERGVTAATSDRESSRANSSPLLRFPDTGLFVLRRASEVLVFDCGPLGFGRLAAHGHADALGFTLNWDGQPVLIDSGTFRYLGAGPWRHYFRGTSAHNTLTVDGRDQAESLSPFQWGRRGATELIRAQGDGDAVTLVARHKFYFRSGLVHQRTLKSERSGTWSVVDRVTGPGMHDIDLYFHFAPCTVSRDSAMIWRFHFPDWSLRQTLRGPDPLTVRLVEGAEEPKQGWSSPRFGVRRPNPVLCLSLTQDLPIEIESRLEIDRAES